MTEDPISLGTVRAEREGNAAAWSPRDVLVDCLKRIDAGTIAPDAIVVVWREKDGPCRTRTRFAQSGPDVHTALGLLSAAALDIYRQ